MRKKSSIGMAAVLTAALGAVILVAGERSALADPVVVFSDDFEAGNTAGWTFEMNDFMIPGLWEIGTPIATFVDGEPAQPGYCASGTQCAFTGQNPDAIAHQGDVDFGSVSLITPPLNLEGFTTAVLEFQRWYYIRDLNEDHGDYLRLHARTDEDSPWVRIANFDNSQSFNFWAPVSVPLHEFIPLTATVQVRFVACEAGDPYGGNILEAAVDDVLVTADSLCLTNNDCPPATFCGGQGDCLPYGDGDCDSDGDRDLADFRCLQACYSQPADEFCQPVNLTGDAVVDWADYQAFQTQLDGPN